MPQLLTAGASVSLLLPIGATLNLTGTGLAHFKEPGEGKGEREFVLTSGAQAFGPYIADVRFTLIGRASGLTYDVISNSPAGAASGLVYITGVSGLGNVATANLAAGWTATGWQWYRTVNGVTTAIAGATSASYTQQAADVVPRVIITPRASGLSYAPAGLVADGVVTPTQLAISGSAGAATVGTAYSAQFTASGGTAPYVYTVAAGSLPAGLSLNASTGLISGTPTTAQTVNGIVLQVADAAGATASTGAFSIAVAAAGAALAISGTPATSATVGTAYTSDYNASGGTGPYTFSLVAGTLPAGLSLNTSTGTISGTPTTAGTASGLQVRVTDSLGATATAAAFSIVVSAAQVVAPVNTAVPVINDTTPTVGDVLSTTNGTWSNTPTSYTYQWKRAGANIAGATSSTYTVVSADIGAPLSVTVTATNAAGSASATSTATSATAAPPPDTRARFFVGPANAHTSGTQALLSAATVLTGAANGGKTGSFTLTTTANNYGWLAVLASASAAGVTFTDASNFQGGWAGAGLVGANTNGGPATDVSTTLFTDSDGTQWRLFRQDYPNANPTAAAWTIS